jgi:hypothetical protein
MGLMIYECKLVYPCLCDASIPLNKAVIRRSVKIGKKSFTDTLYKVDDSNTYRNFDIPTLVRDLTVMIVMISVL